MNVKSYDVLSAVNCCRHIDVDGITCLGVAIEKVFALLNIRISREAALSELRASFLMKFTQELRNIHLPQSLNQSVSILEIKMVW